MKEYGEIYENVSLKDYNTYHIGGHAKYLIKPYAHKLPSLITFLNKENIPWYILGGGSNVILPDEDFEGAIIILSNYQEIIEDNDIFRVEAGINLGKFIQATLARGYVSLTPLVGIPGTLGGAIVGNAGCNKVDIFKYLEEVTYYDFAKGIIKKKKKDIKYGYRKTEFKKTKVIILEAKFKLVKGDVLEAKKIMQSNLQKRKETQPLDTYNAGSVFKNPDGDSAGKLIDEVGLKGFSINGAMVSKKHANFIINKEKATSKDIKNLIKYIEEKVKKEKKVELELEQVIVNW